MFWWGMVIALAMVSFYLGFLCFILFVIARDFVHRNDKSRVDNEQ